MRRRRRASGLSLPWWRFPSARSHPEEEEVEDFDEWEEEEEEDEDEPQSVLSSSVAASSPESSTNEHLALPRFPPSGHPLCACLPLWNQSVAWPPFVPRLPWGLDSESELELDPELDEDEEEEEDPDPDPPPPPHPHPAPGRVRAQIRSRAPTEGGGRRGAMPPIGSRGADTRTGDGLTAETAGGPGARSSTTPGCSQRPRTRARTAVRPRLPLLLLPTRQSPPPPLLPGASGRTGSATTEGSTRSPGADVASTTTVATDEPSLIGGTMRETIAPTLPISRPAARPRPTRHPPTADRASDHLRRAQSCPR